MSQLETAYLERLLSLLPPGQLDRSLDSNFAQLLKPAAKEFARIHNRAHDLVRESDPRRTIEMLSDWEEFAGLPDPCSVNNPTLGERRDQLIRKLKSRGGQDRAYFKSLAKELGYDIEIDEFRPMGCGRFGCGAPIQNDEHGRYRIGAHAPNNDHQFYWLVNVSGERLTRFACGRSACGDPLLIIRSAADLECILQRLKPAHTHLTFIYT